MSLRQYYENGHWIEMPQSNCLFCQRMSTDEGTTSIEVHDDDNQENDPVPNLTETTDNHIETEIDGTA